MAEAPQVTDNTAEHRFEVHLDGDVAFAEYRLKPGQIILPHTVVPPALLSNRRATVPSSTARTSVFLGAMMSIAS